MKLSSLTELSTTMVSRSVTNTHSNTGAKDEALVLALRTKSKVRNTEI